MKKIVTAGIIMILATVLLTGCSWFQPPQEEVKDETKDTQVVEEDKEPEIKDLTKEMEVKSYIYKDEALTFHYPPEWKEVSRDLTFDGSPRKVVKFEHQLNENATVEFRQPILEIAYMGWALKEEKEMKAEGFEVSMKVFEGDDEFAAEQKKFAEEAGVEVEETDAPEQMASLTTLVDESGNYATSYQFYLVAPAEDFESYNEFVEMAVDTFERFEEGGGGIAADEDPSNYPPIPTE
jgi:hypothetical protein